VLDALATPVGIVLRAIHSLLVSAGLDSASGWAWGLSIVLLTVTVRVLLFPLFVKQIKSQRRMQEIAPMVKELQKKHKGDRETLNVELMKLYKENNANPISGCLPLLLQLPVFFALFTVVREFGPSEGPKYGLSERLLEEGARAEVFGAPIAANFRSTASELAELDAGSPTVVRVVALLMVVGMGLSTYWTQRQMIARSTTTDPQQLMVQKFLLYVLPLSFAVSGVIFPIGVLLYWLTTNIWSMGQQAFVIKRMPPPVAPGSPSASRAKSTASRPASSASQASTGSTSSTGAATAVVEPETNDASRAAGNGGARSAPKGAAAGSRKNKNRRKRRR
jgi:YidC/Oxa1 family membrane protein insertase